MKEELLDKSTAYMLFYERESLSSEDYLPHIDSNRATPDFKDLDDDLDDMKKQCNIMWWKNLRQECAFPWLDNGAKIRMKKMDMRLPTFIYFKHENPKGA